MLEIQQHLPHATDGARTARQVAERLLADLVAEIPCDLPSLFEQAEGV